MNEGELMAKAEVIYDNAESWWEKLEQEDKIRIYLECTETQNREGKEKWGE